jgi:hypothetical protein
MVYKFLILFIFKMSNQENTVQYMKNDKPFIFKNQSKTYYFCKMKEQKQHI